MGINLGIAAGAAAAGAITTYGSILKMQKMADDLRAERAQTQRENQERDAAQAGANGTTTAVTPGTLAQSMQGADGKADGDAVMSAYGATQDPTQAPSVSKNIIQGGITQGQMANAAAGQGPAAVQYAQQGIPQVTGGAPVPTAAGGAPASFNAASGDNVTAATQYIRAQEGGYTPNDNGKGPTNYGINGQANGLTPDQVKNLKPEDADAIYKTKYLSGAQGGVDVSKLPKAAAVAVGDTAANMGQGTAKQLWEQSGGDLNKFLDLRQQAYDKIQADPATHAVWNRRMGDIRDFVNQHGTDETGGSAAGTTPLSLDSKVTMLTAKPVTGAGIGSTVTFTHDADGNLQMTKADSAADALQRMATKAFQVGDLKNGPQLQAAALQAKAAEAQSKVTSILTDDKMDQDTKVSSIAAFAGAKAYKTDNGNYIIPGLGPVDARGNPMPMTMTQVGALASSLATPDGLHHIAETTLAMQKAQTAQQQADIDQAKLPIEAAKANASIADSNAGAVLKGKQGAYYEANSAATNATKQAQADDRTEAANIKSRLQEIEQAVSQLDPKSPTYTQDLSKLKAQHDMLLSRGSGAGSGAPKVDNKGEKLADGETRRYVAPDGSVKTLTYNAMAGAEVPSEQEPAIREGFATMAADPKVYKGTVKQVSKNGQYGFALDPTIANNYGLPPTQMYARPEDAIAALKAAQVKRNQPPPLAANQVQGGIPDVSNNPTAALP